MRLVTFATLFTVLVGGAFGFIWLYVPPVAGDYVGWAQDLPAGAVGDLRVALHEHDRVLTGIVALPPSMPEGGGEIRGFRLKEGVVFVTTDKMGNKMTWHAATSLGKMSGYYWWGELSEDQRLEKRALGFWSVRSTSTPP